MGRRWAMVGLLVAAMIGAIAVDRVRPGPRPAHEILAAHMDAARWFRGRSTLPLPWAPWREDVPLQDRDTLFSALYSEAESRDPATMALFLLWRGEPGDLARARRELKGMAPSPERDNEEALILLEFGETFDAYELVQKGLSAAPERTELLFNRALILEAMSLRHQAQDAWKDFLAREGDGPWAEEARQRLARLEDTDDSPSLEVLRYELRDRLLQATGPGDLEAILGTPGMEAYLDELEAQGESIFRREIEYLSRLGAAGWRQRRAAVAESDRVRSAVIEGRMRWSDLKARPGPQDPLLAIRQAHLEVYDAIQRSEIGPARELLEELRVVCGRFGCKEETILAASDYGNLLSQIGDYQGAMSRFAEALAELPSYLRLRRAELLNKQAVAETNLDAFDAAAKLRQEALRLVHQPHTDRKLGEHRIAVTAVTLLHQGSAAASRDMFEVAIAHATEVGHLTAALGFARIGQKAVAELATALAASGRADEAVELIEGELARARETGIPTANADLETGFAEILLGKGEGERALAVIDQSVESLRPLAHPAKLAKSLGTRSRIREALGDRAGAIGDQREAIALVDQSMARDLPPLARVRVEARKGEFHRNLARLVVADEPPGDPWPLLGGKPARSLEADECLVAAVDIEGQTGVFARYGENDVFSWVAAEGPLLGENLCPPSVRRVVVLESPVTVAGLLSPRIRMERPEVAVVVARDPSRPWPRRTLRGKALVVHSPAPIESDRMVPRLPAAPEESRLVREAFPGSIELLGAEATPAGVRALADRFDLLHFAVHGEARTGTGAASYLLLGGPSGRLQVVDVLAMGLKRSPLVVLSSCRGGGSSGDRERDGAGLPWAFLEAGAEVVIATQENLDDRVALEFSRTFYGALASGSGVVEAFEGALDTLRENWSHGVASAFTIYI